MRPQLIAAIRAFPKAVLGTFTVSDSLPWTSDGTPLTTKNLKVIYCDAEQRDVSPIVDTLNGKGFATEIITTTVSFASDAKQLPSNHASLIDSLEGLRLDFTDSGWRQKRVTTVTELNADILIMQFDFEFQRTITN